MDLKVMFYSTLSLRYGGGGERYVLELVSHLKKYGVSSVVVCSTSTGGEKERICAEKVRAILDAASVTYFEVSFLSPPLCSFKSLVPSFREMNRMIRIARDCDVIYFNGSGRVLHDLLMLALKTIFGKPVVSAYHCPLYGWEMLHDLYVNTVGRKVLRRFDACHVLNNDFVHLFESWGLENIHLVPNGVDTEKFKPGDPKRTRKIFKVLFVGRLTPAKGIDVLCESISMINRDEALRKKIAFIIAGSGPLESFIKRLSEQYRNVQFLGYLQESLPQVYRECDLFVLPSRREPFGLVLLEAQASGLPVIAFDVAGPRCILVNEVTGTLVQKEDAVMLAKEIVRYYSIWLNDYERYEQMRLAARENVMKRFDWKITVERIYCMLKQTACKR